MFKRRIQKWKLDKNNKEREMHAIIRVARQRRLEGRSPPQVVRIGRRNIPFSEVSRYFSRKGIREPEQLAEQQLSGSRRSGHHRTKVYESAQVHDLLCLGERFVYGQPVTNVALRQRVSLGHAPATLRGPDPLASFFPPERPERPLSSTPEEKTVQAVIGQTEQYYVGSFDDPLPHANRITSLEVFLLPSVALRFGKGVYSLRCGDPKAAFESFNAIFEGLRLWGKCLDPAALILIISTVKSLTEDRVDSFAQQFLSYIVGIAEINYGAAHPTRTVLHSLLEVAPSMRSSLVKRTLCHIRDVVERDGDSTVSWTSFAKRRVSHSLKYAEEHQARKSFEATSKPSGGQALGFELRPQRKQEITAWVMNQLTDFKDVCGKEPGLLYPERYQFLTSAESIHHAIRFVCNEFGVVHQADSPEDVGDVHAKAVQAWNTLQDLPPDQ